MENITSITKPAFTLTVSNILVTFDMNKIYYVLYIVKILHCCHSPPKGIIASIEVTMFLQRQSSVSSFVQVLNNMLQMLKHWGSFGEEFACS